VYFESVVKNDYKTMPYGDRECFPKENKFCKIATCAYEKKINLCYECYDFLFLPKYLLTK